MKRLFTFIVCTIFAITGMAQLQSPVIKVSGDLHKYKYAYVIPTSGVTASSGTAGGVFGNQFGVYGSVAGGPTRTINPAETISGYLMKLGITILPAVTPEFADQTMIVSYGYTGRRVISIFSYASGVIIQMRDAQTQELVASFETEGCGADETDDILQAIHTAIERFMYCRDPEIEVVFENGSNKTNLQLLLVNRTPYMVKNVVLNLNYYLDGELVHTQEVVAKGTMQPNDYIRKFAKRDKDVRSKKIEVKVEVISYY